MNFNIKEYKTGDKLDTPLNSKEYSVIDSCSELMESIFDFGYNDVYVCSLSSSYVDEDKIMKDRKNILEYFKINHYNKDSYF